MPCPTSFQTVAPDCPARHSRPEQPGRAEYSEAPALRAVFTGLFYICQQTTDSSEFLLITSTQISGYCGGLSHLFLHQLSCYLVGEEEERESLRSKCEVQVYNPTCGPLESAGPAHPVRSFYSIQPQIQSVSPPALPSTEEYHPSAPVSVFVRQPEGLIERPET